MYAFEDRGFIRRYSDVDKLDAIAQHRSEEYHVYRKRWEDKRQVNVIYDHPLELMVEITSWCNYSCKMCTHSYEMNKEKINMSLDMLQHLLEYAEEVKLNSLWLGAFSEPLIHPNILQVIDMFGKTKLFLGDADFFIITNGSRMTEEIAIKMIESGVTNVFISLDAANETTYKTIRGGDLRSVERNIHRLLELRGANEFPIVRVSMVEMDENREEREAFLKKWENKVEIIDFQRLIDYINLDKEKNVERYDSECLDPFRRLLVKYNGDVLPCCSFYSPYHVLGNVKKESLQDLWRSKRLEKLRNEIRTKNFSPICKKCRAIN